MFWRGGRESTNVEDRSGMRLGRGIVGGGIGSIILVLIGLYFGVDPGSLINGGSNAGSTEADTAVDSGASGPAADSTRQFIRTVVGYSEDTWSEIFQKEGRTYHSPKLIIYSGEVDTACGFGQAAMGPFYCPRDREVYLDTSFFQELRDRFHAPGEFAEAYVIAHEIGHHVQNQLGISEKAEAAQRQISKTQANAISVKVELQADCLAGVWAINTQRREQAKGNAFLETGDVEQALGAASMIGDDKLQQRSRGVVVPESFTHGTAEQRVRWFKTGFDGGTIAICDTFR